MHPGKIILLNGININILIPNLSFLGVYRDILKKRELYKEIDTSLPIIEQT